MYAPPIQQVPNFILSLYFAYFVITYRKIYCNIPIKSKGKLYRRDTVFVQMFSV